MKTVPNERGHFGNNLEPALQIEAGEIAVCQELDLSRYNSRKTGLIGDVTIRDSMDCRGRCRDRNSRIDAAATSLIAAIRVRSENCKLDDPIF